LIKLFILLIVDRVFTFDQIIFFQMRIDYELIPFSFDRGYLESSGRPRRDAFGSGRN